MSGRFDPTRPCSFCNEPFSSLTALEEHLVICGNKTDRCPVCKKFIRRAIFAYHYENKCANLDDTPKPNAAQSNAAKSNSSEANPPKPSNAIPCEFCGKTFHVNDYFRHQESCPNRRTIPNQAPPRSTAYSNQNPSFDNQQHNVHGVDYIPCQFCDALMDPSFLTEHERTCLKNRSYIENQARPQHTAYPNSNPSFDNQYVPCRFCDALMEPSFLTGHEETCNKRRGTPQNSNWHGNPNFSRQFECMFCGRDSGNQQSHADHQRTCVQNPGRNSYAGVTAGIYYSPRST